MSLKQLQRARALDLPSRAAMLYREPSVQQFWNKNRELLSHAWKEWEGDEKGNLIPLDSSLLNKDLHNAVMLAWEHPEKELGVQELWQEVAPDVFQCQFFDPDRLADLRGYLDHVWDAQIPLRPPYGIVLNRGGAMLDRRSEGYLAAPSFQAFYGELLNTYMRPIARLLFPETMGYDTQTLGFSIHYQPSTDASIQLHTDASAVTLNINLNLPGEEFTGSSVGFFDPTTNKMNGLNFKPGIAMIHRGRVAHAAQPITSGQRTNLIFWLYGDRGQLPPQPAARVAIDAEKRWTLPIVALDDYAPF